MEKLDIPQAKRYGLVKLWANDLDSLISEIKCCEEVEFIADNVKYDSVEEFIQERKGDSPSIVKILALSPYLYMNFYPHWAELYVASSDPWATGLFCKIDSIISRCERKPRFIYYYPFVVSLPIVLMAISLFPFNGTSPLLHIGAVCAAIAWLAYNAYLHIGRFSVVIPFRREDQPSFIKRNYDAIIVAIISATIGTILGVVVTKLFERFSEG